MANPIFIIGITFLVIGASIAGFVVYHKHTVMVPLEAQEKQQIEDMTCDEVKLKHEQGKYWSFDNWKIADAKVHACFPEQ